MFFGRPVINRLLKTPPDLPITASVPINRLEREVYEPSLQVLRQQGFSLEIVEEQIENSN